MSEMELILYFNEFSSPSRKVLMALYEKGVEFTPKHINLANFEQHERWFLELNPRGEVPVIKHGDTVVADSNVILEYIDKNFGRPNQFFPADVNNLDRMRHFMIKIDAIPMFVLTIGAVVFHTEKVTDVLRFPFCLPGARERYRQMTALQPEKLRQKSIEFQDIPAGQVLAEKSVRVAAFSSYFSDLNEYKKILDRVESILDEVEDEFSSSHHLGPWLCGPTFSAGDLCLVSLLLRLHQIGLDEKLWMHGARPGIAVYQEMAFKRASFERATKWCEHKHERLVIESSSNDWNNSAYLGLAALATLGGLYIMRKLRH